MIAPRAAVIFLLVFFILIAGSGAFADDQYVKEGATSSGASWADARGSIQGAIDAAGSGDIIYVAQGTYSTSITLKSETQLFGGYEGVSGSPGPRDIAAFPSIIDGSNSGLIIGSARHVVTMAGITSAMIDGFAITGGHAAGIGPTMPSWFYTEGDELGGGIYCLNLDDSNTIANCTITGNSAYSSERNANRDGMGGGVSCNQASPLFSNCVISDNTSRSSHHRGGGGSGGGVYCVNNSTPQFIDCTISNNSATHPNTVPSHPHGGGVYCVGNSNAAFINCTISNNDAADNGGGIYCSDSSSLQLINCTISNNAADSWGGGLYLAQSLPTITNCTIVSNSATNGGGIYSFGSSEPTITNTIFAYNSNYAIFEFDAQSDPVVSHCLFYSNPDGDYFDEGLNGYTGSTAINANIAEASNNISGNPLFVNAANGDYHLRPDSPCIDAGKSTTLEFDFEGDARPYDSTSEIRGDGSDFDIGADEFIGQVMDTETLNGDFVNQLYRDFLGREAEDEGHWYYVDLLGSGAVTPEKVVSYFILSPEFNGNRGFINRCYFALFNNNSLVDYATPGYRYADYGGLMYWNEMIQEIFAAGGTLLDAKHYVIEGFAVSPEWQDRIGLQNDADFIHFLYEHILGRFAEDEGHAYHLDNLRQGRITRVELIRQFLDSPEAVAKYANHTYVVMSYIGLLDRAPDSGGFAYHMGNLTLGLDPVTHLGNFIYSPEYRARLAALGIYFPGG